MTSFGWKRKVGEKVSHSAVTAFEQNAKDEEVEVIRSGELDWLTGTLAPKKLCVALEDGLAKSRRLIDEGAILAAEERYWEALKKWDAALEYDSKNKKIHEMKSQAYLAVSEVYPSVRSAEIAVELDPLWWTGYQTLGRAYLGLGEVRKAVRSFSIAVHLYPANEELWTDDLIWANNLWQQKQAMIKDTQKAKHEAEQSKIVELEESASTELKQYCSAAVDTQKSNTGEEGQSQTNTNVPSNYVKMRDYL